MVKFEDDPKGSFRWIFNFMLKMVEDEFKHTNGFKKELEVEIRLLREKNCLPLAQKNILGLGM